MDNLFYRKEKVKGTLRSVAGKAIANKRLTLTLVVGVPLMLFLLFGERGIVQRVRLEQQKVALEEKIRDAERETERLRATSKALDGDKRAIERVAREKHGMIREGETVYRVRRK